MICKVSYINYLKMSRHRARCAADGDAGRSASHHRRAPPTTDRRPAAAMRPSASASSVGAPESHFAHRQVGYETPYLKYKFLNISLHIYYNI